jgi:hypothetical protein
MTKPDQNNAEIALETALENRDAVVSLVQQASSSISLFSRDLDPRVFDNAEFERALFNLARKHKSTDIRILVQDTSIAIRQGHCLIRLAQKLTSSVFVHNPAKEHSREQSTFMIVDNTGMLYRPRSASNSYTAAVNHNAPQRAGELNDYFDEMWERSTPDSQIRRLYL